MAKSKHLSLDDIFAKGSKAFRSLNAGAQGKVPASKAASIKRDDPEHLASFAPHAGREYFTPSGTLGKSCPTCGGPAGPISKPRITFTLFRVQLLDLESKSASVKYLLDGLRYAELIPDDREKDAELFVFQVRVDAYLKEGTAITIEYPT